MATAALKEKMTLSKGGILRAFMGATPVQIRDRRDDPPSKNFADCGDKAKENQRKGPGGA
jgi:hypothetical protein